MNHDSRIYLLTECKKRWKRANSWLKCTQLPTQYVTILLQLVTKHSFINYPHISLCTTLNNSRVYLSSDRMGSLWTYNYYCFQNNSSELGTAICATPNLTSQEIRHQMLKIPSVWNGFEAKPNSFAIHLPILTHSIITQKIYLNRCSPLMLENCSKHDYDSLYQS